MQILGPTVFVVCKPEYWGGLKKAKQRWDSASLGAKDFKRE
jgi:hypothetical protein